LFTTLDGYSMDLDHFQLSEAPFQLFVLCTFVKTLIDNYHKIILCDIPINGFNYSVGHDWNYGNNSVSGPTFLSTIIEVVICYSHLA